MPVDENKTPLQILELPAGLAGDRLLETLNDRIHQINAALKLYVTNPATGELQLGDFKITHLADPKDDLDAVNLRTLKRHRGGAVEESIGTGDGIEEPTIYFTFDGVPFDGEESPFAIILENRDGFNPVRVGVSAVGPATSAALAVNLTIEGVDMLAADLELAVGSQGPVYSSTFALPNSLRTGTLIQGVIAVAGGATQVTIALSLRGK